MKSGYAAIEIALSSLTGQSGEGRQAREGPSFLKKRSKKLLFPRSGRGRAPNKQKFFGSFFQKRTAFFLQPIALHHQKAVMTHPDPAPTADYAIVIEALPADEGGGYLATVPDLPGCMSDGATREMAVRAIADAITAWIDEATALNRPIPLPSKHLLSA